MTDRHTPFWNKRSSDSEDDEAPKDSKKSERGGPFYSGYDDDDDYEYEDVEDIDSDSSSGYGRYGSSSSSRYGSGSSSSTSNRYGSGSTTPSRYGSGSTSGSRYDDNDDTDDDDSGYGSSTTSRYGTGGSTPSRDSSSTTSRYGAGGSTPSRDSSSTTSRYGTGGSTPSRDSSSTTSRYGAGGSSDSSTTSRYGTGGSTSSRYGTSSRDSDSSTSTQQKRRGLSLPGRGGRDSSSETRRGSSTSQASTSTARSERSGGGLGGRLGNLGGGLSNIRKRLPGGGKSDSTTSTSSRTSASTSSRYGTGSSSDTSTASRYGASSSTTSPATTTSQYGSRTSQTRSIGQRTSTRDSSASTTEKKGLFNISLPFGRGRGETTSRTQRQPSTPRGVKRAKPLPQSAKRPRIKNEGISLDLKLDIAGWGLVILSAIIFFGAISSTQGDLSRTLLRLIYQLVGVGWIAVPIALGGAGIWLIWRHFGERAPEADYVKIVGWGITYLGALATAHFIHLLSQPVQTLDQLQAFSDLAAETGYGGGWLGGLIYMTLIRALGDIGTFCLLIGWWGIGIIIATDLSIADIIGFVSRVSKRIITRYKVIRAERAAARRERATSQTKVTGLPVGAAVVATTATLQETAATQQVLPEPQTEAQASSAGRASQIPLIRRRGRDAAEISPTDTAPAETPPPASEPSFTSQPAASSVPAVGSRASTTRVIGRPTPEELAASRTTPAQESAPAAPTSVAQTTTGSVAAASSTDDTKTTDGPVTLQPGLMRVRRPQYEEATTQPTSPFARADDKPAEPAAVKAEVTDTVGETSTAVSAPDKSADTADVGDLLLGGSRTRTPAEIRAGLSPALRPEKPSEPASPFKAVPEDKAPETEAEEIPEEDLSFMRPALPRNPEIAERRTSLRQRGTGLSPAERAALDGQFAKPSDDDEIDEEEEPDEVLADEPVYEPLIESASVVDDIPAIELEESDEEDEGVDQDEEDLDEDEEALIDIPRVTTPRARDISPFRSRVFASLDDDDEDEESDDLDDIDEDEEDDAVIDMPRVTTPRARDTSPFRSRVFASLDDDEESDDFDDIDEDEDEDAFLLDDDDDSFGDDDEFIDDEEDEEEDLDYLPSRPSVVTPSRTTDSRPVIRQTPSAPPTPTREPVRSYTPPTPARTPAPSRPEPVGRSIFPEPTGSEQWTVPDFREILDPVAEQNINDDILLDRARIIEDTLSSFGAPGKVVEVNPGPVITQFGVEPDYIESRGGKRTRVKVQAIARLADDLALSLAARSIRIEAPVPGKGFVGIEVPNAETSLVSLRDIMDSPEFDAIDSHLRIGLGQSVDGSPVSADLTAMPHLLIAGTTGSGKSVLVNALITCLLLQNTPETLRFIMVDPKRVELTGYNGIPHLVAPVVVDLERIVGVLKWVTREMDDRYKKFNERGARNIANYNSMLGPDEKMLPYLVIVVDELADLMMLAPDETERVLTRLAQMSRATGIHLIISTQRPSVDIITGLIKANFPSRVAFAVASSVDSRVILDQPGAERLLGRGDMLFQAPDAAAPVRLQGVFVSDTELNRLVNHWKGTRVVESRPSAPKIQAPSPRLETTSPGISSAGSGLSRSSVGIEPIRSRSEKYGGPDQRSPAASGSSNFWDEVAPKSDRRASSDDVDELYDEAVAVVRRLKKASVSLLQRQLRIGYTRAARLIDVMEERNVVGPPTSGSKPRKVIGYTDEEVVIDMEQYSGDD